MKNECNVVRDLMPLVIDGVASEESKALVDGHVAVCEPCRQVYSEYVSIISTEKIRQKEECFEQTARQLKRNRNKRRTIIIAATVLMTAAALLLADYAWDFLNLHSFPVDADSYSVRLIQIKGTDLVLELYENTEGITHWSGQGKQVDGKNSYEITAYAPLLHGDMSFSWNRLDAGYVLTDGKLYHRGSTTPIDDLVQVGRGGTRQIIYQQGDTIPISSDELAACYDAYIAYTEWWSTHARYANEEELETRKEQFQALYDLVPEFK